MKKHGRFSTTSRQVHPIPYHRSRGATIFNICTSSTVKTTTVSIQPPTNSVPPADVCNHSQPTEEAHNGASTSSAHSVDIKIFKNSLSSPRTADDKPTCTASSVDAVGYDKHTIANLTVEEYDGPSCSYTGLAGRPSTTCMYFKVARPPSKHSLYGTSYESHTKWFIITARLRNNHPNGNAEW